MRQKNKKIWFDELISKNPNPTYKQLLNTFEWSVKRFKILRRDKFACSKCDHIKSRKQLQVHHTEYIDGLMPWEYEDKYLVTLCDECHSTHHGHKNLQAIFRKNLAKYIKNGCKF